MVHKKDPVYVHYNSACMKYCFLLITTPFFGLRRALLSLAPNVLLVVGLRRNILKYESSDASSYNWLNLSR